MVTYSLMRTTIVLQLQNINRTATIGYGHVFLNEDNNSFTITLHRTVNINNDE